MALLEGLKAIETEDQAVEFMRSNFVSALPAEAAADPNVTKYKSSADFYNAHRGLTERIGKSVVVPDKDSPAEVRAEFNKRMGIPDKPEGYTLTELKDLHGNIKITPESKKNFLDFAHSINLTSAQTDAINKWYLGGVDKFYKDSDTAWATARTAAEAKFKSEWGADYDRRIGLVNALAKKRGILEIFGEKDAQGNFKILNPKMIEFLDKEASKYGEDEFKDTGAAPILEGDKAVLEKFLEACRTTGTPENTALMDANHKDHSAIVARRTDAFNKLGTAEETA